MTRTELEDLFESARERALDRWRQVLRFPSVSADPRRRPDCLACAQWLKEQLDAMGFAARLIETCGLPLVLAERDGPADQPTALYYAHYDVQPVEPVALWETPPFEPTWKADRLYARGAQDNKGQMIYALAAIDALRRAERLPGRLKIVLEGEEESSGHGLDEYLTSHPNWFRADLLIVTDTFMDHDGPAITMGLRGVLQLEARVQCAAKDLHSGQHGGAAPNAAHVAAALIAGLHERDGRVAVPGFYEGLREPTAEERARAAECATAPERYARLIGVAPVAGEPAFSLAERTGFRPCLDVNGMCSGHTGEGMKTVIPHEARFKLSARIVAGQDPQGILDGLIRHLQAHTPSYARLTVLDASATGPALRLPLSSPAVALARRVLDRLEIGKTVFRWEGASVPVVSRLAAVSGAAPLLVGFGQEADNIHAPNESFSLSSFRAGFLYIAGLLSSLDNRIKAGAAK
jgi:acetylornithine deacetylase/succinyl-diaminopimelate desuccinylase-like protein